MKKLNTLSRSKNSKTQSQLVKKKKILLDKQDSNKKDVDKIDILFELEKKAVSLQRNVRKLLARKKMEQLLVMKLILSYGLLFK